MSRLQNDRSALFLVIGVVAVLAVLGMYTISYSRSQVASLASAPAYHSPGDAMIRWQRDHGAIRVDITHEGQQYFLLENLWSVRADVWLNDHETPLDVSRSFLRTPRGWVLVPEDRHGGLIALGQSLLP